MGLGASAELIWGIPVLAYDEDTGSPTPFWSEEDEDWAKVPEPLEIVTYGHYEDPDNQRAVLTYKDMPRYWGDCWEPKPLYGKWMDTEAYHDAEIEEFWRALEAFDPTTNEKEATWWLVASYG